jgi:NodT family efflux transporter outer membrane factor (OMF) lipoprotein
LGATGQNAQGFQRDFDVYDVGSSASWEIDLFGGLRRARQAANAYAQAAADEVQAVRVVTAAETADAYLQVREYQARLGVARRQEAVETHLVELVERKHREGLASEREVHQARAALEGVRATEPRLLAGMESQLNRLDVLSGAPAGTYAAEMAGEASLPSLPSVSAVGGPADLLRRRPDILIAERELAASDARIGESLSEYYPKISLGGLVGVESMDSNRMFVGNAVQYTVSGVLQWRLFDFARINAEVAQAKGKRAEELAAYRAVIYRATAEVETSLSDLIQYESAFHTRGEEVTELTHARAQAQNAYDDGLVGMIDVLDADRNLLEASDELVRAQAGSVRAAVAVFRATGGGWEP